MALINCPDCSKEVSDQAPSCLHCGCPIANNQLPPPVDYRQFVPLTPTKKNNYGVGFAVYLGLIVFGSLLRAAQDNSFFSLSGNIIFVAGIVGLLILILRVCFRLLQKV